MSPAGVIVIRREIYLPLVCGLIGTLWGICWVMVHRQSELDRTTVYLDRSLPFALAGLVCGAVVGRALQAVVGARPVFASWTEAFLVIALSGSLAAPFGLIARDANMDWSGEAAITRAAAWGAIGGLAAFATISVIRAVRRNRGRASTASPSSSHSAG